MDKLIMSIGICSLEMSVVSAAYMLLLKLLKKRQSPVWRYYSWLIILIGFLIPIKPSLGKSPITVSAPLNQTAGANISTVRSQPIETIYTFNPWKIVFMIWLCGMFAYLAVTLFRCFSFGKSVKRLSVFADKNSINLADKTAKEMGISAPVKLMILSEIHSPMMTGLLSPVILLPNRKFTEEELRLILKHELTHFKHMDLWVKVLTIICRAVHWFNPFMIAVNRSIEQECELACDYDVIKNESVKERKIYCQSILKAVSVQKDPDCGAALKPVMATNFYSPKQGLKRRLSLILSSKKKKRFVTVCIFALVITSLSGAFVTFANDSSDSGDFTSKVISENKDNNSDIDSKPAEEKENKGFATTTRKSTDKPVADHIPETTTTSAVPMTVDYPEEYRTTTTTIMVYNN